MLWVGSVVGFRSSNTAPYMMQVNAVDGLGRLRRSWLIYTICFTETVRNTPFLILQHIPFRFSSPAGSRLTGHDSVLSG